MSSASKFQGTPAQAWQAALGQLQLEISKSTFDKWVSDSFFIAFEKDTFSVGAADQTTRDWLESHLSGLLRKILTGVIGEPAKVAFFVAPRPDATDPSGEDGDVPIETSSDDEEEHEIEAEPFWYSGQEAEVKPTIGTFLPGYFVHYLPLLSHPQTLLYMGLYRTALVRFLSTSGGKAVRPPAAVIRVSNSIISQRSGLSARTVPSILRQAVDGTWFGSLVRRLNPQDPTIPKGEHSRKMPRIQIAMDLPLLPHHADWIAKNLRSALKAGVPSDEAIRSLMALSWDVFLPFDPSLSSSARPPASPLTVDKIIEKELTRAGRPVLEQDEALGEVVSNVRSYIARSNHTVGLSDYLLQNWRPYVASGGNSRSKNASWPYGAFLLISYLRYLGYINFSRSGIDTKDVRDTVEVSGGLSEIAARLGLRKPETVHGWLKESWMAHFVRPVNGSNLGSSGAGWVNEPLRFRIAMMDPRTPGSASRTPEAQNNPSKNTRKAAKK
jgi:hypothetical protein